MKKGLIIFISVISVIAACTKKIAPTTGQTEPAKTPVQAKTEEDIKTGVSVPTIATTQAPADPEKPSEEETGKVVYAGKCGRCHALKNVSSYTFTQWGGILKTMIPNAKLSADEESQVVAYIKAHAKQ